MRVLALVARYAQLASWTMIIRKAPRALCDMRMAMYCSDVAPHTATAAPEASSTIRDRLASRPALPPATPGGRSTVRDRLASRPTLPPAARGG